MIPIAALEFGEEERDAVCRVLDSGVVAQGPEVDHFEAEFSHLVGGRSCVAVNSGTSALHLGLLAAGIGPGDEVIVPSFTFAATANSVVLAGASPVFVDIDPATYCMAPDAAAAAITSRTAALLPVHLYGHPADMGALGLLARRHSLAIFEDAAQAHMAELDGQRTGTYGDFAAFSFYATKNMTTGEGGMVVTSDEKLARRVRLLRNQGMEAAYQNELVGFNSRMTDLAAAIGRVQLKKLPTWTETRRKNAALFDEHLSGVATPVVADGARHVYHQYTVRTENREGLEERLVAGRVGYGIYYRVPVHRLPAFSRREDLPETERATAEVLSLPVRPGLTEVQLQRIVEAVNR